MSASVSFPKVAFYGVWTREQRLRVYNVLWERTLGFEIDPLVSRRPPRQLMIIFPASYVVKGCCIVEELSRQDRGLIIETKFK